MRFISRRPLNLGATWPLVGSWKLAEALTNEASLPSERDTSAAGFVEADDVAGQLNTHEKQVR